MTSVLNMLCNGRYMMHSSIGKGSFGEVVKCFDIDTQETVAIKILTDYLGYDYLLHAREEVDMLMKVRCLDPDNIVQFHNHFVHRGQVCLVFEMLDMSLHDLLMERDFKPFSVMEMRPIIQQLAMALKALKDAHIIHADVKPDNVMLVNQKDQPFKVKLIDFGQSMSLSEAEHAQGLNIQSRYYRSPEVLLGLPISQEIDIWSLGCIMAAGVMGQHLYPGNCEYDMMRFIIWAQGMPAPHMLNAGLKTTMFFTWGHNEWRLKTPEEYCSQTGIRPADTRCYNFNSLDDMINVHPALADDEVSDMIVYMALMKNMLHLDSKQRPWPSEALEHPFITMSHLVDNKISSSYVKASVQAMSTCTRASMQPGLQRSDMSQEVETSSTDITSRGVLLSRVSPNLLHHQQSGQETWEEEEHIHWRENEDDSSWHEELPSTASYHNQAEQEFWEEVCPTSFHNQAGLEVWEEEDESSKEKGEGEEVAVFSCWTQLSNPNQHCQSSYPQAAGKEDWEEETGVRNGEENGGNSGQSLHESLLETRHQKKHSFHKVRRAWRGLLLCANMLRSRMLKRRTQDGCRRK